MESRNTCGMTKNKYLSVIKKYVEIHGTVFVENPNVTVVPNYVINHGILSGTELHKLLQESKLFIGLGFPYEGPAPLEAIAQGCVFINPKFNPPHNSANTKFFHGKPTLRKVTSQHPYAEDFIGEPNVRTVDIGNTDALELAIKKALVEIDDGKVGEHLPYEFTHEGMLQRVNAFTEHQDFCSSNSGSWPPILSVNITPAAAGKSCKDVCWERRQICEPAHFKHINSKTYIERFHKVACLHVEEIEEIYVPALDQRSQKCILQKDPQLFSCVGESQGVARLCPCRKFIPGQTALCTECL